MIATLDGKEIAKMPLVAAVDVPEANLWETMIHHVKSLFTID